MKPCLRLKETKSLAKGLMLNGNKGEALRAGLHQVKLPSYIKEMPKESSTTKTKES